VHRERNQGKVILHAITFHDRCSLTLTSSLPPKNIHIWSFKPSRIEQGEEKESTWTCLYDTQTNGGSISQLYFRHNAHGLQAISKSDDQKLRVWDLSWEEKRVAQGLDEKDRPKRPGYVDVASTENTVGVGGNYAFSLSSASEAIINLIPLDADDLSSPFNVTELALPMIDGAVDHHAMSSRPSRSGRQQRGAQVSC
jgi:WD40 repeat protein